MTDMMRFPNLAARGDKVKIMRIVRQAPVELHRHEFHELVVVFRGKGLHYLADGQFPVAGGDVFVIPPGTAHGYGETANLELVNILYLQEDLNLPRDGLPELPGYQVLFELEPNMRRRHGFHSRLHLAPEDLAMAVSLVKSMENELGSQAAGYQNMVLSQFMHLRCFLSRCYVKVGGSGSTSLLRIGGLLNYMERHCAEPVALESLAEMAHMSVSSLHRMFKQSMGLSPIEHLLRLRVAKGAELLRQTDLPVGRIALQAGFRDGNYFARQFRRINGLSPRQYRDGT
jgi:AraC-like DNA-binding protein